MHPEAHCSQQKKAEKVPIIDMKERESMTTVAVLILKQEYAKHNFLEILIHRQLLIQKQGPCS